MAKTEERETQLKERWLNLCLFKVMFQEQTGNIQIL